MPTFAITYVYDDRADRRAEVRPEHRRWLAGLLERGDLLASGPWTGGTTPAPEGSPEPDGALLLVRAADASAALALLDPDPFRSAGLLASRSARPWEPVLGPWS